MISTEKINKTEVIETWQTISGFKEAYAFSTKGRLRKLPQRIRLANGRTRIVPGEILRPNSKDGLYWICVTGNTRICLSPKHLAEGKLTNLNETTSDLTN